LFVSVVTMGELRRGITLLTERSSRRAELERMIHEKVPSWFQDRILPVTRTIAERWGVLDGERQLAGRPLNIADGMIAATALEHGLTLVTRNMKDFAGLGLALLNPWDTA
jgi:predicted nucleic acid-binding protein